MLVGATADELGLAYVADAEVGARAARMEPAATRWVQRTRHVALQQDLLPAAGKLRVRHRQCFLMKRSMISEELHREKKYPIHLFSRIQGVLI